MQDLSATEKFVALSARAGADLKKALVESGLLARINTAFADQASVRLPAGSRQLELYQLRSFGQVCGFGFKDAAQPAESATELVFNPVRKGQKPYYRQTPAQHARNIQLLNAALK